jgi:hypothetical protein
MKNHTFRAAAEDDRRITSGGFFVCVFLFLYPASALHIFSIQPFLCVRGIFILCVIRNPSMRAMRALCVHFK